MTRAWKVVLLTVVLMLLASNALAQEPKGPSFSTKDRQLIEAYYSHLIGNLAPGSLDRSSFPLEIEKALVAGSHIPLQLEKDLMPLPAKLESQLSQTTGGYGRYTLGRHVVLIKKGNLAIADVLKNVAMKEEPK